MKDHDDCITLNDVDDIYDEDSVLWRLQKNSLSRGNHRFFINKFIENTNDNGFVNREGFKITDEAKNKLFSGLHLPSVKDKALSDGMISYKKIKPKSLFYNAKEKQQVEELKSLLEEENFKKIQDRLKETNFRCGFACLFYGAPGTGKTETVLQIARLTGRDLTDRPNNSSWKGKGYVGQAERVL